MVRVVITGAESSGKTTLAKALAQHFSVNYAPEFAREFLEKRLKERMMEGKIDEKQLYSQQDLITILDGQFQKEHDVLQKTIFRNTLELIICDTDSLTIKIWSEQVFKSIDPILSGRIDHLFRGFKLNKKLKNIYFLCSPEGIEWQADPLRENPTDRQRLFDIYKKTLNQYGLGYFILRGGEEERLAEAVKIINRLLNH
ncbi:MAG: ATP-binding protein [Saprospiraceae bacterium]|nr:ATP-binding protein [Saprospiraceae bacterium]